MSGNSDPVSGSAPESGPDSGSGSDSTPSASRRRDLERSRGSASSTPEESGPRQPDEHESPVSQGRSMGTWMLVRGVLGFAFGLATIFWPRETLADATQLTLGVQTVDLVLIAYLVLNAGLLIGQSRRADPGVRTALLGQAVVVVPAVIFLFIADTPPELRAAVCIWALLHGGLELWIYWMQRSAAMSSDHLIAAGCHLLLGVIVAFGSNMGALTVFGFAGAAVLISSVLYMLGGYSRRSRARA